MELKDVDQFVREGKYAQALQAIDRVRAYDPQNPYTAAYEVRVRLLLEDATRNPPAEQSMLPSIESQFQAIATPLPPAQRVVSSSSGASAEMDRIAILSRIADLLGSATGCLSRGEYDQALVALEEARLLDPGNTEIAVFEDRVRGAREDAITLLRSGGTPVGSEPRVSEVPGMLTAARAAAAKGDFSEALRSVTTAAILEPDNEEVGRCEGEIRALQQERQRQAEERKKAEERKQRKETERLARMEVADADQERRHTAAVIARHVARARSLLNTGEYGHAMVEIDHAFLLNPLDAEVRRLQQEITEAQDRAATDPAGSRTTIIAGLFAEAQRLRASGKLEQALQVIGRILLIDPANADASGYERRLQAELASASPLRGKGAAERGVPAGHTEDGETSGEPRRNRKKTYLLAASFLAAAVAVLIGVTQVLSWAEGLAARPAPPLPLITTDSSLVADRSSAATALAVPGPAAGESSGKPSVDQHAVHSPETPPGASIPGVVRLEQPVVPETALGADGTDRVTVRVLVDSTGRPMLAAIVQSSNSAFDQPVINAAMRSTYKPWSGGGMSGWITIPFTFTN